MAFLEFDGVDNFASFPFFQNPGELADWTFALVFNAQAQPTPGSGVSVNGGIVGQSGTTNNIRWLQHFVSAGQNILRVPMASNLNGGLFSLDTWYLVFLRRTGSPSSLRINLMRTGLNQTANHTGVVESANLEFFLGFNGPNFNPGFEGWWPGRTAYMAHWDRRLSDAEVTAQFDGVKAILAPRGISL